MTVYINRKYKNELSTTVDECETYVEMRKLIQEHNVAEPDKDVVFYSSTLPCPNWEI